MKIQNRGVVWDLHYLNEKSKGTLYTSAIPMGSIQSASKPEKKRKYIYLKKMVTPINMTIRNQ